MQGMCQKRLATAALSWCCGDKECHALLLEAMPAAGKQGRPAKDAVDKGDNVTNTGRGTSASHTLRRLKRDSPVNR